MKPGWEWIIILLLALLLFGGFKKMPDAARGIGRSLRIFKAETKGLVDDDDKDESPAAQAPPAAAPQAVAPPVAAPAPLPPAPVVPPAPIVSPPAQHPASAPNGNSGPAA